MKFNELNEEQKAKALDYFRNSQTEDSSWFEHIKESFHERLEEYGFSDIESSFSGFASQGDGASFTAGSVDVKTFINKIGKQEQYKVLLDNMEESDLTIEAKVYRIDHMYSHSNTVRVDLVMYVTDLSSKIDKAGDSLQEEMKEFVTTESDKYYRDLEEECNYLESDEAVREMIEANDYDFETKNPTVTYL